MDRIRIICSSEIPALSVAKLVSYSQANQVFTVEQPDGNNLSLSELVFVPEKIPVNKIGWGLFKHFGVLKKTGTVAATDFVGSTAAAWTVKKYADGKLYVVTVLTNNVIVRPIGGGSTVQWAKVQTPMLSHNAIDEYSVKRIDDIGDVYGSVIYINRAIGCEGYGTDGLDIRHFIPWFAEGAIVPIVQHYDVIDVGIKWYIDLAFSFIGKPADKSIDVEEITSGVSRFRSMAVYK